MQNSKIIFLSPHLDDAAFSCGGIINELVMQGHTVEVWTLFTADPPKENLSPFAQSLHDRWRENENPSLIRRQEDLNALKWIGADHRHLDFPDCIYRSDPQTLTPIIQKNEDLFSSLYPIESELLNSLVRTLKAQLPNEVEIISPLGMGGHIDHRLTRMAAEALALPLWYYPDFPYAAKDSSLVNSFLPQNGQAIEFNLTEKGMDAWINAIACYKSQLSSFWDSHEEMDVAVRQYASLPIGQTLWHSKD